jgi:hypothetical protein
LEADEIGAEALDGAAGLLGAGDPIHAAAEAEEVVALGSAGDEWVAEGDAQGRVAAAVALGGEERDVIADAVFAGLGAAEEEGDIGGRQMRGMIAAPNRRGL